MRTRAPSIIAALTGATRARSSATNSLRRASVARSPGAHDVRARRCGRATPATGRTPARRCAAAPGPSALAGLSASRKPAGSCAARHRSRSISGQSSTTRQSGVMPVSPAACGPAAPRWHRRPRLGQDLMVALRGDPGLFPGVEAPGGVEVPVAQVLADDADAVRVLAQIELGGDMPELMRRDPDADVTACALGDGFRQDLTVNVAAIPRRERARPRHGRTSGVASCARYSSISRPDSGSKV